MTRPDLLLPARKLKHAAFVAGKRARLLRRDAVFAAVTRVGPGYAAMSPYSFDPSRYRRSFLVRDAPVTTGESELPRQVFVLWVGENPLTPRRRENLAVMRERIGLPVELVTPENLGRWVLPEHPLHPAYENLSLVHRSDYLRAYLMHHHHGGGYCDLKAPTTGWQGAFARAERDPEAWLTGYAEAAAGDVTRVPGTLGKDLALHYSRLAGMGAYLVRSHTPFTAEWLREVERRLDYYAEQAAEFPGGTRGEVVGYPVSWTRLLGGVLHPLQLKHLEHVRQDPDLLLEFENYQ